MTAAHLAAPPVVELWAVAAGGALLLVMLLLFHLHMTGAGDVKLLMLVLYAAPDGGGLWIWLLGLAVAGVLGACRLTGLGLWKERLCRLEQCLRDAGAGRRIIYYDRKRDGTRAVIPMAGCILLAACAVMAAGGTGV